MSNATVLSVLIALEAVAIVCCAISVFACSRALSAVKQIRGTTSLLAELHETRDYVAKIDGWAKRVNARLTRWEEKADPTLRRTSDPVASKAELRRRVGIVPGRPAPHTE